MAVTNTTTAVNSFAKTPQAVDDNVTLTENNTSGASSWFLDVMSNDLGGNAKTLWSIDDGANSLTDLLTKDSILPETTALGASIRIGTQNGVTGIFYSNSNINALGAGETLRDSFTYAIRLGNGTLSWATVSVNLQGVNDSVTLGGGPVTSAVMEDTNVVPSDIPADVKSGGSAGGTLTTGASFSFDDADTNDIHTATVTAGAGNAVGGTLTTKVTEDEADGTGSGSVSWTYSVGNAATQFLAQGETAIETFTVTVDDGHGGAASQTVSVTVTGVNDAVTISAGSDDSGAVTEDDASPVLSSTGTILFDDVDLIDAHAALAAALAGNTLGGGLALGTVSEDGATSGGSVAWTYTVNNGATQSLAAGETATETFTVVMGDGNGSSASQTVTVVVTGVNDDASITGDSTGGITEDGAPSVSGQLVVSDVDHGEAAAVAGTADSAKGSFGVDASGAWTYTVDNGAIQHLGAGITVTETFTVASQDGTASQDVSITITGVNDAAGIAGTDTGSVTEDDALHATAGGQLTIHDVDDGEEVFVANSGGTYGAFVLNNDGSWTYALNNGNAAVQALATGGTLTDTLNVRSVDNTSHVISVTIHGADEPVVNTNAAPTDIAFNITQNGNNSNWGFFSATDPDAGDSFTWSIANTSGPDTLAINATTGAITGGANNTSAIRTNGFTVTVQDSAGHSYSEDFVMSVGANGNSADTMTFVLTSSNNIGFGLNANDVMTGSNGIDYLSGGAQNDILRGNGGADVLQGGGGSDTFRFAAASDSAFSSGIDTILDWSSDTLAFSTTLLAGISLAGAGGVVTGAGDVGAGKIGWMVAGGDTTVFDNTSGGMMEILLKGSQTLNAGSFATF